LPALLAIDPGLQGTGAAFWRSNRQTAPDWVDVITYRKGEWTDRAMAIAGQIKERLVEEVSRGSMLGPVTFVCELMEMHQSARAQMMWKSGDFQRTLVFTGMMVARVHRYVDEVELVKPSQWKGQLPKAIANRRVAAILGEKACRELDIQTHAWDAVGIGLWKLGRF
jgi:hypothetical protein